MNRLWILILSLSWALPAFGQGVEPSYRIETFGEAGVTLHQPRSVQMDASGRLFVMDGTSEGATIRVLSAPGEARGDRFREVDRFGPSGRKPGCWFHPANFRVSAKGGLLVADTGNRRILRFTDNGTCTATIGGKEKPEGALAGPTDALELPDGRLIVCDAGSSRVLLYDASGKFRSCLASEGSAPEQVLKPFSLALSRDGDLWIADTCNRRLVQRGRNFAVKRVMTSAGEGGPRFEWPAYLAFDRDGNLLAADAGAHCIYRLSPDGKLLQTIGGTPGEPHPFDRVSGLCVAADGTIYASDAGWDAVLRFDASGKLAGRADLAHHDYNHRGVPDVAVASDGSFYVARVDQRMRAMVQHYDARGYFASEFGGLGLQPGKFQFPAALACGSDGLLYVADRQASRVSVFRRDGALVRTFGKAGSGASDMWYPRAIAVVGDLVYVGDAGNQRVQVYQTTGEFVRTLSTFPVNPARLDVDASGDCALWDDAEGVVISLDPAGKELWRTKSGAFREFTDLAFGPDGKLWALDGRASTMTIFDAEGKQVSTVKDPQFGNAAALVRSPADKMFLGTWDGMVPLNADARVEGAVPERLRGVPGAAVAPTSLALVFGDELAVLSGYTDTIQIFGRDGKFRRLLVTDPPISNVSKIAGGPRGELYALMPAERKLYRVSREGKAEVAASGELFGSWDFVLDPAGRIIIPKPDSAQIAVLDPEGKPVGEITPAGRGRRWETKVLGCSPAGDIFILTGHRETIACYSRDLKEKWTVNQETLGRLRAWGPQAIGVDRGGSFYEIDRSSHRFYRFDPVNRTLAAVDLQRTAHLWLDQPNDLAVDADGTLFIADTKNNRIVKITPVPAKAH